ncbi:MAG: hypothetical protein NZ740_08945 [Kiritimatiellae bacterium]|nr:hypothetical protein [Kiritimatiellia bacterium]MDW8459219.1 hypothetical protein [Verrucomicrobiota bacterium]
MNRQFVGMALMSVLLTGAAAAEDLRADASLKASSARIFRGVTLNDGWVLEPAVRGQWLPFEIGATGFFNLEDYDGAADESEFAEVDWDVAVRIPVDTPAVAVRYKEYHFPDLDEENVWREISADGEFGGVPLSPGILVAYGLDGAIEDSFYSEAGIRHDAALADDVSLRLGARVAYTVPEEGESGFSHYTLSASVSHGMVEFEVAYVGQLDDEVLPDAYIDPDLGVFRYGYDAKFAVTAALRHRF